MTYRLGSSDPDSVFARYGPSLAHAPAAARAAHPLIENVWVQTNRYARQVVIEVWWTREVTREEATESVRAVRNALQPWFDALGIDSTWHVSARRGRPHSPNPWLQLVPLLRDDCRETEVRKRWPREPQYVDRTPRDAREAMGPKKAREAAAPLGKARGRG